MFSYKIMHALIIIIIIIKYCIVMRFHGLSTILDWLDAKVGLSLT